MPLYLFDLYEAGRFIADEQGCDLADPSSARAVAVRAARDVMATEILDGWLDMAGPIVVRDSERREVLRMPFAEVVTISR